MYLLRPYLSRALILSPLLFLTFGLFGGRGFSQTRYTHFTETQVIQLIANLSTKADLAVDLWPDYQLPSTLVRFESGRTTRIEGQNGTALDFEFKEISGLITDRSILQFSIFLAEAFIDDIFGQAVRRPDDNTAQIAVDPRNVAFAYLELKPLMEWVLERDKVPFRERHLRARRAAADFLSLRRERQAYLKLQFTYAEEYLITEREQESRQGAATYIGIHYLANVAEPSLRAAQIYHADLLDDLQLVVSNQAFMADRHGVVGATLMSMLEALGSFDWRIRVQQGESLEALLTEIVSSPSTTASDSGDELFERYGYETTLRRVMDRPADQIYNGFKDFFDHHPYRSISASMLYTGHVLLPVSVNGKIGYFIVDNGSAGSYAFGNAINWGTKVERSGRSTRYILDVQVGGHPMQWTLVHSPNFDRSNSYPDIELLGLIGNDIIGESIVQFDYAGRHIVFRGADRTENLPDGALERNQHLVLGNEHVLLYYISDIDARGVPSGRAFVPGSSVARSRVDLSAKAQELLAYDSNTAIGEQIEEIVVPFDANYQRIPISIHVNQFSWLRESVARHMGRDKIEAMTPDELVDYIRKEAKPDELRLVYYDMLAHDFRDLCRLAERGFGHYDGLIHVDIGTAAFRSDSVMAMIDGRESQNISGFSLGPMHWSTPTRWMNRNFRLTFLEFPELVAEVGGHQLANTKASFYFKHNRLEIERISKNPPVMRTRLGFSSLGTPLTVRVVGSGSTEEAMGVQPQDEILALNGERITGITHFTHHHNRGRVGQPLTIEVRRPGVNDSLTLRGFFR